MKQNSGKQLIEKNIRRKIFFPVIKFGGHQKKCDCDGTEFRGRFEI